MKLIIATPSPFARKVRVILREKGIDCEEVIDIPWNKNTITDGLNPLGKIPILLSDGIEPVFDSKNIVEYLELLNPEPTFYPENHYQKLKARLVETAADGVCDAVVLIFWKIQEVKIYAVRLGSTARKKRFIKDCCIYRILFQMKNIL